MAESQVSLLSSSFDAIKGLYGHLNSLAIKANVVVQDCGANDSEVGRYSKELATFKSEVVDIYNRSSIFIQIGQANITALMGKEETAEVVKQLSDTVTVARALLAEQENVLPTITTALSASDAESRVAAVLQIESQKLGQSRKDTHDRFDRLFTLCEDQLQSQLQTSAGSTDDPLAKVDVEGISDVLKLSFYKTPFQVYADDSQLQTLTSTLALLNTRRGSDVNYVATLEGISRTWIDDFIRDCATGPRHITQLGERYIQLLDGFRHFLVAEIASLPEQQDPPAMGGLDSQHSTQSWWNTSQIPERLRSMAAWRRGGNGGEGEKAIDLAATEAREIRQHAALLKDIYSLVSKEIEREKTRKFSVALCGMVKSGKSLFLSAVLGHRVLPSDELPSTAWPCRIRHVKGQTEPHLVLCPSNAAPIFQNGIKNLRTKLAEKGRYRRVGDTSRTAQTNDPAREDFEYIWDYNVAPATKANWEIFKRPSFELPNEARGDDNVYKLLAQMNDVVRLCRSFGVEIPVGGKNWPLITVEFDSLRDEHLDGVFEFYDLPGMGEFTEYYLGFQELINVVAREVNAIVPIVSLKEVSKNDWRTELPQMLEVSTGLREPSLIICTHRDQVETEGDLKTQTGRVLNVFSSPSSRISGGIKTQCVSCSSRLGLGAQTLLKLSRNCKPGYDEIFNESVPEVCRTCARHILGNSRVSKRTYERFSDDDWRSELRETLVESGLTEAMDQFITTMAKTAQSEALLRGITSVSRLVHKMTTLQSETLIRMRRTKSECEEAREGFRKAERKIQGAQRSWEVEENRLRSEAMETIRRAFDELERECVNSAGAMFGQAEVQSLSKHQNVAPYQSINGTLRFSNEHHSTELLRDVLGTAQSTLESKKGITVFKLRREAVDEEIRKQLDFLCAAVQSGLGDAQSALASRLDTEMGSIGLSIREVPFTEFSQKASTKAVEWSEGSCWERSRVSEPLIEYVLTLLNTVIEQNINQKSEYTDVAREKVICLLQDEVIRPFIANLRTSADTAFTRMMELGRDVARGSVNTLLKEEKSRYELELSKKDTEPSQKEIASSVAAHMNLLSAAAALQRLEVETEACVRECPA
ncbi:hypothetical protein M0805_002395 [Coniferiporia weirii]|nr:hypothetical protein M0805_002395 [Coniferiporia weirii]